MPRYSSATSNRWRLWAVIGETAVRKNIGDQAVLRAQLPRLIELCRSLPNLTVQVLPLSTREHYFTARP